MYFHKYTITVGDQQMQLLVVHTTDTKSTVDKDVLAKLEEAGAIKHEVITVEKGEFMTVQGRVKHGR